MTTEIKYKHVYYIAFREKRNDHLTVQIFDHYGAMLKRVYEIKKDFCYEMQATWCQVEFEKVVTGDSISGSFETKVEESPKYEGPRQFDMFGMSKEDRLAYRKRHKEMFEESNNVEEVVGRAVEQHQDKIFDEMVSHATTYKDKTDNPFYPGLKKKPKRKK